jgi:DNA-binding CsgD family transcriptional regulator
MALQLRAEREEPIVEDGDGADALWQSDLHGIADRAAASADAPPTNGVPHCTAWPSETRAREGGAHTVTSTTQSWTRAVRLFARSVKAFNAVTANRATRPGDGAATPAVGPSTDVGPESAPERHRRPAAGPARPEIARLTRRQRQVAALIAHGYTDRQIAQELVLTPGTASNHVANILRRLDCRSRAEVAAWAVRTGLLAGGAT